MEDGEKYGKHLQTVNLSIKKLNMFKKILLTYDVKLPLPIKKCPTTNSVSLRKRPGILMMMMMMAMIEMMI